MSLLSKLKETVICLQAGGSPCRIAGAGQTAGRLPRASDLQHREMHRVRGLRQQLPRPEILVHDICQEVRIIQYVGRRCTYCGRCADVCPRRQSP